MLKFLQGEMPKLWTGEQYSAQFKASSSPYKDFDHALKHIQKATQALVNMVEEADHAHEDRSDEMFPRAVVEKYLADIVISVVRATVVNPAGKVDLEQAVRERIEKKMGVRLAEKV